MRKYLKIIILYDHVYVCVYLDRFNMTYMIISIIKVEGVKLVARFGLCCRLSSSKKQLFICDWRLPTMKSS